MQQFLIKLQIALTKAAVIKASIVYIIANTKKLASKAAKVTIRNIAKNVAATNIGQSNNFSSTIANIIVATGMAKNSNKVFIFSHLLYVKNILFYILFSITIFCYYNLDTLF